MATIADPNEVRERQKAEADALKKVHGAERKILNALAELPKADAEAIIVRLVEGLGSK